MASFYEAPVTFGTTGADTYDAAEDSNEVVFGGAGDDTLNSGAKNGAEDGMSTQADEYNNIGRLYGGTGNDEVIAGGADRVIAGAGDDVVDARGDGGNRVYGGPGDDEITYKGFDKRIFAGAGNDLIDGSTDADGSGESQGGNLVFGEEGSDIIVAGENDRLYGGDGDDRFFLNVAGADNTVTGGSGADTFYYNAAEEGFGVDTLTDFSSDEGDKIVIHGMEGDTLYSYDSVEEVGTLSFDGDEILKLEGVASLNPGDVTVEGGSIEPFSEGDAPDVV